MVSSVLNNDKYIKNLYFSYIHILQNTTMVDREKKILLCIFTGWPLLIETTGNHSIIKKFTAYLRTFTCEYM